LTLLAAPAARRVRVLATIAFVLAMGIALGIRLGLNDGGWPLFVPAIAAAGVLAWPVRVMLILAIAATTAIVVLGIMTVGILYGFSLAALIFALAEFKARADRSGA
jgi:ABC-type anion transport system duplicated permease subunit